MTNTAPEPVLKPARKKLYILAILLIVTTSMASSYGGNVVLPNKLVAIGAMDYYPVCTALQSMGMMLALPLVGVFCGRFGTKAVVLFGLALQFATRLAAIYLTNIPLFLVVWMASGISGGLYLSAPYAMISELVSAGDRPRYFGYIASFNALGALIGPFWTGVVQDSSFAQWALISYIPLAIVPLVVLFCLYPNRKRPTGKRFDFMGIVLLVLAVCCMVLWLSLGGKLFARLSALGIAILVAGVASLVGLVLYERRQENPSVPVGMFRKKRFTAVFLVQCFITAYGSCAAAFGIVYVQQVMQGSALASATVTMPQTIVQAILGLFIGAFVGKAFAKRFRPLALVCLSTYVAALLLLFSLRPDSSMLVIYVATAVGGVGQAISQSVFTPFFQTELAPEEFGAAQGMASFSSTGGSCIFKAICAAAMNGGMRLNQVFLLAAGYCAVALIIGLIAFRLPSEDRTAV